MAKMKVQLPDELQHRFETAMSEMDDIAEKALKTGAKVLIKPMDSRLRSALSTPRKYEKRQTGELLRALGTSPMKIKDDGAYDVRDGFAEPRTKQPTRRIGRNKKGGGYYVATNAMVANILQYGHKGTKGGQAPAPWLQPALRDGKKDAEEAIRKTVEGRLDEIFNKE